MRVVWADLEFICCSSLELVYKAKTNKNNWNNNIFKKPCQQLSVISLYFDKSFLKQIQNNLKGEKLCMIIYTSDK